MRSTKKTRASKRSKGFFKKFFHTIIFSHDYLPILMTFIFLSITFVLVRMKVVDQHYQHDEDSKRFSQLELENKVLKATNANLLSIDNLRKLAKKYDLQSPKNNQVIVIPD
jgi:hypothetical protein